MAGSSPSVGSSSTTIGRSRRSSRATPRRRRSPPDRPTAAPPIGVSRPSGIEASSGVSPTTARTARVVVAGVGPRDAQVGAQGRREHVRGVVDVADVRTHLVEVRDQSPRRPGSGAPTSGRRSAR